MAGAALCEPRGADFVVGTALCEPPCADSVAGAIQNAFSRDSGRSKCCVFQKKGWLRSWQVKLCGTTCARRSRVMVGSCSESSLHCGWSFHLFLEVQISWQAQHFVNLHAQISWQAQHFVNLHAQTPRQAQHFVNLHVQISWQAQHSGELEAENWRLCSTTLVCGVVWRGGG